MTSLVDAGGLVALADRRDRFHPMFRHLLDRGARDELLIIPITVLPEVDHLVTQRAGAHVAIDVLRRIIASDAHVEHLVPGDLERILELTRQYADANIGLVDASLVAVAERLGVRRILTLDRRHFGPIRPRHCPAFEILP